MKTLIAKLKRSSTQIATGCLLLFLISGILLDPPAELHLWTSALLLVLFLAAVSTLPSAELTAYYRFTLWGLVFGMLLNLAWELWHSIYFTHFTEPGYSYIELVEMLLGSVIGDGVIILGLLFTITVIRGGSWQWRGSAQWPYVLLLVILAAIVQTSIEIDALNTGLWAYNAQMPRIPLLDLGLTPILQMPMLAPLSFWMAQRMVCCQLPEG